MSTKKDTIITLKTGGGKSALWMTTPLIDPKERCIVICPFVILLEEQVAKCMQLRLWAHNFTKDKNVPLSIQILFVQVESTSSKAFQIFMASPEGFSFEIFFVDEHHDFLVCHPDRKEPWLRLAAQFSKWPKQINLLSATSPPSNTTTCLKAFLIHPNDLVIYCTCTDHLEIGLHVLHVLPNHFKSSLQSLVCQLQLKMSGSDHMLIFFSSNKDADNFGTAIQCAVFHSDLPTMGENTKAQNLMRWESGETKVMVCTTAFAQGVDRSSVCFVVISEVEYGLMVVNQMLGRSGRDGREAHTFYLTQKTSLSSFESGRDYYCIKGLDDVLFTNDYHRYTSIKYMDGRGFAYRCNDRPDTVKCDVCSPTSEMQGIALQALKDAPLQPSLLLSFQESSLYDSNTLFRKASGETSQIKRVLNATEAAHAPLGPQCIIDLPGKVRPTPLSFSQPIASRAFRALPPPSSLPAPVPSSSTRSMRVTAGLHSRLDCTSLLDRYMRKLRDCCPVHFGIDYQVHKKDACPVGSGPPNPMYYNFKKSFTFQRFTYCFKCALPQNYNHNKEEPSCHSQVLYQKGVPSCPFAGFIFEAVLHIWKSGKASHLAGTLGQPTGWVSYEEFVSWVNEEEKDQGRYINLLEIFIAFCKRLEESDPNFFR
ncbi:P-loop containing nucleoside triphosphate hydrolase protein [Suillus plorans]|uniref:DNA 3'-5' helicase n=1 Tax=Suillus plorans TaxID=116603 RepID=A0A9P7AN83_9AGAM|nr:P-loop containing nucleoside triphosphate hydrolase protein [Suillus plorans]KAG1791923.1 P-loop containing nucleoside triphosphate hydrolase protein [Suillus plorans]